MFGLLKSDIDEIRRCLMTFAEVEMAYILGSRAMGNYKNGSDVDIALKGSGLNFSIISKISYILNEDSAMPYHFDILNYHDINNEELLKHIDRVGIILYQKEAIISVNDPKTDYGKEE